MTSLKLNMKKTSFCLNGIEIMPFYDTKYCHVFDFSRAYMYTNSTSAPVLNVSEIRKLSLATNWDVEVSCHNKKSFPTTNWVEKLNSTYPPITWREVLNIKPWLWSSSKGMPTLATEFKMNAKTCAVHCQEVKNDSGRRNSPRNHGQWWDPKLV